MKQQGAIVLNGREIAETRQCCHCGQHYVSVKGSGKRRGFCFYLKLGRSLDIKLQRRGREWTGQQRLQAH